MSGSHSRRGGQGKGVGARSGNTRKQTAREVALDVLTGVEQEGAYSNLELNRRLQQAGLSASDAGLATELVYGTVARRNTLDYFLNKFVQKERPSFRLGYVRCCG